MPTKPALPLLLNESAAVGGRTNLCLGDALKDSAAQVARTRYGWSLSHLARALLQREVDLKKGLLHAHLREAPGGRRHGR